MARADGPIVHVSDYYLPRLGGIEMQMHGLAQHQRAAGERVEVWTTSQGPEEEGVRRGQLLDRHLRARLAQVRPSVVHAHISIYSPYATVVAREAARMGIPTVLTIHSMWSWLGPAPRIARALLGLRRWPVVWSAVSERAANPLRRMLGPGYTVHVLPNSTDVAAWAVEPDPTDVPTIVSVLRFAHLKRPLPLVRMLREVRERLPDSVPLQARLIGDGQLRERTQHYIDSHGMGSWVELLGRMDREDIRKEYAHSSLYVAPATMESFGIAALEARAAGLPVVASSRGGVGEFITPGLDGLMAPTDGGMVNAMVSLLRDPVLLAAMQAHNRATPPDHDWSRGVGQALGLYRLAGRNG